MLWDNYILYMKIVYLGVHSFNHIILFLVWDSLKFQKLKNRKFLEKLDGSAKTIYMLKDAAASTLCWPPSEYDPWMAEWEIIKGEKVFDIVYHICLSIYN
ncbi:hypothetical protein ACJX0J_037191 [Zea mays]